MQLYKVFFGEEHPTNKKEPSDVWRRSRVDRSNEKSPLFSFVGNDKALKKLQVAAYDALGKPDHLCREIAFAFFGPSSSGKTTLARKYAQIVELPFVEISPKSVKTLDDVFKEIERVLANERLPLIEVVRPKYYFIPPCIIFIDEVHALNDYIIQGLLKATEYNDAQFVTESGRTLNCFNVCWMIATTDEGELFEAFRTRFSPVNLKYLTKPEISRIVKLANSDLPVEVCDFLAHYNSRIPRKALEFARYMKLTRQMDQKDWVTIAKEVATDEGIDDYGMHETHLCILKALGQGPVAKNRIVNVAGRKMEECERFIMPWLLTETEDQPAMVTVSNRGYTITPAGLKELERRNISHKGSVAMNI